MSEWTDAANDIIGDDAGLCYQFEERAGIVEHDGGRTRDDAEYIALMEIVALQSAREHG